MSKTKIEWVKNPDGNSPGWTWNPITGCLNHDNGFCKGGGFPCYAYRLANGRLKPLYWSNHNVAFPDNRPPLNDSELVDAYNDPFYPRFWPRRLEQPFDIAGSAGIFTCDMSDLFGIGIPHQWTESIMNVIKIADRHRFYLLTKQPQNLAKWSPFPPNVYLGVSATNQDMYDTAVYHLGRIQTHIRYISLEPLLSPIHLPNYKDVDWLIIGAQTKPDKQPQKEWVEEILAAACKAATPIFMKNNLKWEYHRQEMP